MNSQATGGQAAIPESGAAGSPESENIAKVLLMGRMAAGKTSMRSIIFANYLARDAYKITFTVDVNKQRVRFLGNLVLSLWDCGGQDRFMEQYFESQRDHIFQNVGVLIFVFDVTSKEFQVDLEHYMNCLSALTDLSQNAKIFVLVHKMDLIREDQRDEMFNEKMTRIMEATSNNFKDKTQCFRTSIWDETLYKAWSSIVYMLIPNVKEMECSLNEFAEILDADEVLLFEKATFLGKRISQVFPE